MTFNYSICHPDKELIEYPTELIDAQKAIELAKTYPWKEQLQLCDELPDAKIYYSPSLDFKNTQGKSSFGITADELDNSGVPKFSLWYSRPIKVRLLFGLLGQTERMLTSNLSSYTLEEALQYLKYFLDGNKEKIEALYKA